MLQIVAWNSQGAKWDVLANSWVSPLVAAAPPRDVMAFVTESGWAPWVTPGAVTVNSPYSLDEDAEYFYPSSLVNSQLVQWVSAKRRRSGIWIPWVAHYKDFKPNTRCSLGGVLAPLRLSMLGWRTFDTPDFLRPILRTELGISKETKLTVFAVHFVSGKGKGAQKELDSLIATMQTMVPEGSPAFICGDMNIDLLKLNPTVPKNWKIIRTGVATQQKGGELDWGLLYDPTGQLLSGTNANIVQAFKSGNNGSDHSVLRYDIPL